jgi:hypothetical protein
VAAAGGILPFIASVRHGMSVIVTDPSYQEATSLIRVDTGALVGRFLGRPPGAAVEILFGVLLLGSAGAILWTREARAGSEAAGTNAGDDAGPARHDGPRPLGDGLACLAILLGLYHQSYDTLLLVLPIATLLWGPADRAWPWGAGRWRWGLLALLLVPWLNVLATYAVLNRVQTMWALWLPLATCNGAALLLAYLIWAWRMSREAPSRSRP